ncbi:hypothetical protein HQ531_06095 [bacterium]|nr:hypothetical protein [bacterium]
MKRVQLALWVAVTLIFIACETNLTQPAIIQDSSIESGTYSLAKDPVYVAKLDSTLPDSTVYGPLDDSTKVFWANGGEQIPTAYWVDNLKSSSYKTHLYAEMKATFDKLDSVAIASPSNMDYLNSQDTWVAITSSGKVFAKAVRTGAFGGGSITLDVEIEELLEGGGGGQ